MTECGEVQAYNVLYDCTTGDDLAFPFLFIHEDAFLAILGLPALAVFAASAALPECRPFALLPPESAAPLSSFL